MTFDEWVARSVPMNGAEYTLAKCAFAAGAASRDAEIAELKAQQCTSPFADSPPCRGIQRERDMIAELVAALENTNNALKRFCPEGHLDANEALAKVRKP